MTAPMTRRLLLATATLTPLLWLPGCASGPRLSLVEAIRRLLSLSAQRALAGLMRENGFYDDQIARVALPDALGGARGSGIVAALLGSGLVRTRLTRQLNRAAEQGANAAAPVLAEAIAGLNVDDAAAIISGGGDRATMLLRAAMGDRLLATMLPDIDRGLRLFDSEIVTEVLRQASGIDFTGLRDDVTRKASAGIYAAIAREEAAIRANPQATNDPLLIAVFALAS